MLGYVILGCALLGAGDAEVSVGYGQADITPKVDPAGKAVWIAGYGMNRPALGVHDKLWARAFVLKSGDQKVALVIVDLVGLMYPAVLRIREKLEGYSYVMVASTHVHEGPDVIGMWGERPLKSGVDPAYIDLVVERTAEAITQADQAAEPALATYGTATDEEILRDSREPYVKDGIIRVLQFKKKKDGSNLGILLQQNCHPESLADKNQYLTADFNFFTIKALEAKYSCPVAVFSGAVGGLMTLPGTIKKDDGTEVGDGNFEYAEVYGNRLARRAIEAMESSSPATLAPLVATSQVCYVPIDNPTFKLGYRTKALNRDAYLWSGDAWAESPPFDVRKDSTKRAAMKTEVCYVRMGDIHLAGIPGEAYPESVYGKFQEPVDPNADFPDAPLEKSVIETLPGEKFLFIGLANDEVGYILPKRQWDNDPPFAYGREKRQYGEVNSVGPEVAPILYKTLEMCVEKASAGKKK